MTETDTDEADKAVSVTSHLPHVTINLQLHCLVESNSRDQAARPISTAWLKALQPFHLRPINLVVYEESLGALRPGNPNLEGGLALRCFQRLSSPDTANQRCPWRDNWDTGGPSP